MPEPIVFISHHKIKEGKLADFKQFAQRGFAEIEADKPGTVVFLAYLNADSTEVSIIHIFPDAASMDLHMQGAADRSKQAYRFIEPISLQVYGTPSEGVLETMQQIVGSGVAVAVKPQYLGGFTRLRSG